MQSVNISRPVLTYLVAGRKVVLNRERSQHSRYIHISVEILSQYMVGGYEVSLVIPEGTPPKVIEEYFELVREKERHVNEKWGGRTLTERTDYFKSDGSTSRPRFITKWLDPKLLAVLDEDRIDALFEPADGHDPVIYDCEKISNLLSVFQEGKADFISSSEKQMPELWYEGTYIALLEFARDHDTIGVSIPR